MQPAIAEAYTRQPCLPVHNIGGAAQDARAPLGQLQGFYTQLVLLVRRLFQDCRLVHADLSEYNILVNQARLTPLLCWG